MKLRDKITLIESEKITPYEKNNKKHPDEQISLLVQNIDKFGFTNPILIDKNNVIIAGHARYEAGKRLGLKHYPCIKIEDLSDDEIKTLRISDNRVTELAEIDWENLKEEWFELKQTNTGIEFLTGYKEDDFIFLEEDEINKEVEEDDFEHPEDIKTDIKQGDIIQLGNHRLMCGNSTSKDDVSLLVNIENIDICFHSPPYNVGHNLGYDNDSKYKNDSDNNNQYVDLLNKSTENALENCKYCFVNLQFLANNKRDIIDFIYNFKKNFADIAFWKKSSVAPAMANKVMNSQTEVILIFGEEGSNRAISTANFRGNVSNIIETSSNSNNEFSSHHNAGYPLSFVSHFINFFSQTNALDLFGGTGTTLIACEQLDRKCYMMELDPMYCEVICQRWEKLTGKQRKYIQ